jgi:predicted dehydrogenase
VVLASPEALQHGLEGIVERVELKGDAKEPLRAELESFLRALQGEAELVVTGEDGRRALEVALNIVELIESNVVDPSPA